MAGFAPSGLAGGSSSIAAICLHSNRVPQDAGSGAQMARDLVVEIRDLLDQCSAAQREDVFRYLRRQVRLHEFEDVVGASAETILEALHQAPELTRRMIRGVIADAAFRAFILSDLASSGWRDVTPEGNHSYDYVVDDGRGPLSIQVKLQRSERGAPVQRRGAPYGFQGDVFIVETQRTRTGTSREAQRTRPYRDDHFDVLAVSLQPSSGHWNTYSFTLARWLIPGHDAGEIATIQPVTMEESEYWTRDFSMVAFWFRSGKTMARMSRS